MRKVLSIIIPCYNSEKFLAKALNSCISEKVIDKMEVIIVNDGSKDQFFVRNILSYFKLSIKKIVVMEEL